MSDKKRNNNYWIIWVIVLAVIAMLILFFIWILTNSHETLISDDLNYGSIASLQCYSNNAEKAFFDSKSAQRYTHTITATFKNDKLDDVSYSFEGTYRSNEVAETDLATMHAKYNEYMGGVDVYSESLNPVFNAMNTKMKIALYAEPKNLSEAVMTLFFLEKDDYGQLKNMKGIDFEKKYESRGFKCTFRE